MGAKNKMFGKYFQRFSKLMKIMLNIFTNMDKPKTQVYIAYNNDDPTDIIAFEDKEECKDFCLAMDNKFTWTSIPIKLADKGQLGLFKDDDEEN